MTDKVYDLVVIGAGSGGVRAARMAATQGHSVAIVEKQYLGGTCVNVGCVPKKLFSYAAHFAEDIALAQQYGWQLSLNDFNWTQLVENKNRTIERLNTIYQNLLENSGVDLFWGCGRILATDKVEISPKQESMRTQKKILNAKRILIATGGVPFIPDFPGAEYTLTSDDVFYLPRLSKRIAIVGGGYIAVEFASIFNALGVETHLVYRGAQILKHFDADLALAAQNEFQKKGIQLHLNMRVERISKHGRSLLLHFFNNTHTLEVDQVLIATGRVPNLANLGLDNVGVKIENGFIVIDEQFSTTAKNIFALGDVRTGPALTPVAIEEAMVFVDQQFNGAQRSMDYANIATAVFSLPNLATVGLTEAQAREQYANIDIYKSNFTSLKQSFTAEKEKSLLKLVVDADSDRLLGMHLMASDAGEIIQGFAVAIKMGVSKAQLDSTVGIHPTMAEEFVTMRQKSI